VRWFPRRYTPRDIAALIDGGVPKQCLWPGPTLSSVGARRPRNGSLLGGPPSTSDDDDNANERDPTKFEFASLDAYCMVPAPHIPRARVSYKQPVRQYCRRVKEKLPARAKGVHTRTQKNKATEC
jgi:hypothetical protein